MSKALFFLLVVIVLSYSHNVSAQRAHTVWEELGSDFIAADLLIDSLGNTFVTGGYLGKFQLEGFTFPPIDTSFIEQRFFIAKLDTKGHPLWVRSQSPDVPRLSDSSSICSGRALAFDPQGNVIVLGDFTDSVVTIGTTTLVNSGAPGTADLFIAKYSPDGTALWAKQFKGSLDDNAVAIASSSSSVFVAGYYSSDTLTIGTTRLKNSAIDGSTDMWIASLDFDGNVKWAKTYGGPEGDDEMNGLVTDNIGNLHFTADAGSATCNIEGHGIANPNSGDIVITGVYTDQGAIKWLSTSNNLSKATSAAITIDQVGVTYIIGSFTDTGIGFGGHQLLSTTQFPQTPKLFVVAYDPLGNVSWADKGETVGPDTLGVLPADCSCDGFALYLVGAFGSSAMVINGNTLPAPVAGGLSTFAIAMNSSDWIYLGGGIGENACTAVRGDPLRGRATIAGNASGSKFVLNGQPISIPDKVASFLVNLQESLSVESPATDQAGSIELFPNPFSDHATIQITDRTFASGCSLTLYDNVGRAVFAAHSNTNPSIKLERNNLPAGVYHFIVRDEKGLMLTGKAVIE